MNNHQRIQALQTLQTILMLHLYLQDSSDVQLQQIQLSTFSLADKSIVEGILGDLRFDPDPTTIVDDKLSEYLEASIHQTGVGLDNNHTRERFLSEFTLQKFNEINVEPQE